jgi:hypothetical protein
MSRFVVDADGLIKLGKSGALLPLIEGHEVLVPEDVFVEAVVRGKRELHEDAFELERVLGEKGISAAPDKSAPEADRLLEGVDSLGAGERGALRLYFAEGADAVVSDDRVFLRFLTRHSVPFLTPTNVLVGLTRAGRMSLHEGSEALKKLSGYVRADVYEGARAELEDLRKEGEESRG